MRMWPFFTSMALIWFVSYSKTDIDDLHGGVLPFFFCWGGGGRQDDGGPKPEIFSGWNSHDWCSPFFSSDFHFHDLAGQVLFLSVQLDRSSRTVHMLAPLTRFSSSSTTRSLPQLIAALFSSSPPSFSLSHTAHPAGRRPYRPLLVPPFLSCLSLSFLVLTLSLLRCEWTQRLGNASWPNYF